MSKSNKTISYPESLVARIPAQNPAVYNRLARKARAAGHETTRSYVWERNDFDPEYIAGLETRTGEYVDDAEVAWFTHTYNSLWVHTQPTYLGKEAE